MKYFIKMIFFLMIFFTIFGCAYRYYLGFHGPSIKLHPDQHEGVVQDKECLECHDPNNDVEAPPTPHPHFTGCLKCHNDDITPAKMGEVRTFLPSLKLGISLKGLREFDAVDRSEGYVINLNKTKIF